jgi:hypothetical protein
MRSRVCKFDRPLENQSLRQGSNSNPALAVVDHLWRGFIRLGLRVQLFNFFWTPARPDAQQVAQQSLESLSSAADGESLSSPVHCKPKHYIANRCLVWRRRANHKPTRLDKSMLLWSTAS